jgi:hypothetical protein
MQINGGTSGYKAGSVICRLMHAGDPSIYCTATENSTSGGLPWGEQSHSRRSGSVSGAAGCRALSRMACADHDADGVERKFKRNPHAAPAMTLSLRAGRPGSRALDPSQSGCLKC